MYVASRVHVARILDKISQARKTNTRASKTAHNSAFYSYKHFQKHPPTHPLLSRTRLRGETVGTSRGYSWPGSGEFRSGLRLTRIAEQNPGLNETQIPRIPKRKG